jgi:hypothetical protein
MSNTAEDNLADWNLDEWEHALTLKVGTAYVCRACQNVVMVTRGGVGVMDLVCCGKPMDKVSAAADGKGAGRA